MFREFEVDRSWLGRNRAASVSVAAHLLGLAVIVFHNPKVIEFTPTSLAHGDSARTYQITYIPSGNEEIPTESTKLSMPSRASKPQPAPRTKKSPPKEKPHQTEANAESGDQNTHAGTLLGTVLDGPITGHEVRVALPIYPEPQVDRADLPRNLAGDVVIEVTIDSQGNVVDTKIVQAIGNGIDEKIEATLRRRHYQPALLDGTPVASRQDVHFHFPS